MNKNKFLDIIALFSSSGTLICCALPMTVATIAGGAALSSLVSLFPFLVTLSQYKNIIFIFSGSMIALNGYLSLKPVQETACDEESGEVGCEVASKYNRKMFYVSLGIFSVGIFTAYLLGSMITLFG